MITKPSKTIQQSYELNPISFSEPITLEKTDQLLLGIKKLKLYNHLKTLPISVVKNLLNTGIGVEIELENSKPISEALKTYWEPKADSSLRGAGIELVTHLGARVYNALAALSAFGLEQDKQKWEISDRTGLHIHLNVRNLTMSEINSLMILYSIVEDSLFEFVGSWRKHNIFCTPLLGSCTDKSTDLQAFIRYSRKYCALNTKCITEFGTVEFRHMQTTLDIEKIMCWIFILTLLKRYASQISLEELKKEVLKLKTRSNYREFYDRIFYGFSDELPIESVTIDNAITNAKLFFYSPMEDK